MTTTKNAVQTTKNELETIIAENNIIDAEVIVEKEVNTMDGQKNLIQDLTKPSTKIWCSFELKTRKEKVDLFNATNEPDETISDNVNKVIQVVNVFAEEIYFTDEFTGEITPCARMVFLDKDNKSYSCCSVGMYSSLQKAFATFGVPSTWLEPLPILIKNKTIGKNKLLTFTVQ